MIRAGTKTALSFVPALFILCALSSFSHADDSPELPPFRAKVLAKRVKHVLEFRASALSACAARTGDLKLEALAQEMRADSDLLHMMELYQRSVLDPIKSACTKEIQTLNSALRATERKRFRTLDLGPAASRIFAEIDPRCAPSTEVLPDFETTAVEPNPCSAGDALVLKTLFSGGFSASNELRDFVVGFHGAVSSAADGSTLDLMSFFTLKDPKIFWAMMAFLVGTSSSKPGYVDGVSDYIWQAGLRFGHSPQETLDAYHDYKRYKDLYRSVAIWASNKKIKLVIAKLGNVSKANHHNYMAAFLSCHYMSEGETLVSLLLPSVLGNGYESIDFVSHIKQGIGLKPSIQNFAEDTHRYKLGTRWAYQTCR